MAVRPLAFAFSLMLAFPLTAGAQIYNRPPVDLDDEAPPARPDRDIGASLKVDRLERELRQMTGRVEELQHDVDVLKEQLRGGRQDAAYPSVASPSGAAPVNAPTPAAGRRGDAFDPSTSPSAAGAPRLLGTTTPSAPLTSTAATPRGASPAVREAGAPLDLTQGRLKGDPNGSAAPGPAALLNSGESTVDNPASPKDDYDRALGSLRSGQYESAEKGFSEFLTKNPKSRLAATATYNLAESYFLRGRHREAAEKYLEISTKYAQSAQAPEAMLRLGQSLHALGAREQACASFSELGVKYPNASAKIKDAATRESKKIQC
jgi:tol-pal system protein YbgF